MLVPVSWKTLAAFGLAVTVATAAHELGHHLVAAVECGGFGRASFTRFQEREGCQSLVGNTSGPVISFLILWWGAWAIRSGWGRLRGFAAVIGAMPLVRLASVMSGGDDWNYVGRLVARNSFIWPLSILVLALIIPPMVLAWRAVGNRHRWAVYLASLLLPLFPMVILQPLDVRTYFTWIDHPDQFHQPVWLGVPLAVWAVYLTATLLFVLWAWPWMKGQERQA